jgi:hypothetical protein
MAKTRLKSPGQRYVEEQLAKWQAAQKAAEDGVTVPASGDIDAETRTAIEQEIGRKLTTEEIFLGRIQRADMPPGAALYDMLGTWKPKLRSDPTAHLPLADEIEQAEAERELELLAGMTEKQQRVYLLKKQQTELLAKEKAKADHAARMADPKIKATLEKLRALDRATAMNPKWNSWEEIVVIQKAIASLETEGADEDAAMELAQQAFRIDTEKRLAVMSKHEAQVEALRAEIALQNEELRALGLAPLADSSGTNGAANSEVASGDESNGSTSPVDAAMEKAAAAEAKYRNFKISTSLLDAALPKALSQDTAKLIADHLAKSATVDANDNVLVEIEVSENGAMVKKQLTPDQAVAQLDAIKFGSLFRAPIPKGLGAVKGSVNGSATNGTDITKMEFDQLKTLKDDPLLAAALS